MKITETNKGNVKLVMSEEEFKALHGLVDFPSLIDWNTIAVVECVDKEIIPPVWNEINEYHKFRLL